MFDHPFNGTFLFNNVTFKDVVMESTVFKISNDTEVDDLTVFSVLHGN